MIKRLLSFSLLLFTATWLGAQLPPPCPSNFFPPADNCTEACIYCNFNGISSSTAGYTGGGVPGFCGTIENEQWLGFIAGCTSATFTATASGCTDGNGIQVAVMEACGQSPIACYGGQSGGAGVPASVTAGLIIGQNYFFMIDGFAGDQCSFNISVSPPQCVSPPPLGNPGPITGPTTVCPGATVTYSIPLTSGAAIYTWNAPPGSMINGQAPPLTLDNNDNPTSVEVTFGSAGGQVCVQVLNSCAQPKQVCKQIIVQPIPPTNLAPVTICFEDAPYEAPWGDLIVASGLAQVTLNSWLGCDSVVRQQVTVKPPLIKVNPPQTICIGSSISVCGNDIDQPGPYQVVCQSFQGCDSTVTGQLLVFDPVAEIIGSGAIACNNNSVVLNSAPSQGFKQWFNAQGQIVGSGPQITVNQPGSYVLVVTATTGLVTCTAMDTVTVTANNTPPNATAAGGTIGCTNNTLMLNGGSTTGGVSYAWSSTNGFTSSQEDPIINAPGTYVLTVTNPSNGCTSTASAMVNGNTTAPQASATGGTLSCATTSIVINASSNVPNATYAWSNGQFIQNPSVNAPNNYVVTVTDPSNGCTSTATANVTLNNTPPNVTAAGGTISCATPNVTLAGNSTTGGATFAWSGPGGFSSANQNPSANSVGTYTLIVTGTNGCTASQTADVAGNTTPPGATAAGGTLTCAVVSVVLNSSTTTPGVTYSWSGPGGYSSTQPNPTVDVVGNYVVTITGSNSCTSTATATVNGNFTAPNAGATGGTISCTASSVTINGSSTTPGVTFVWTGPGGNLLNGQNVSVSSVGDYTLVVTGANGCTATATATVNPDANLPNAVADGGTISCSNSSVTLSGSSTTPGTTLSWTGPGGFISSLPNPTVTVAGDYILLVSNPTNGCNAQATAGVQLNTTPPTATVAGGQLSCGSPNLEIFTTAAAPGLTFDWSGPNNFISTDKNPTVAAPGNYTLVVTGTNGCTASFTATVTADTNIPVISATASEPLTCAVNSITINATSNNPNVNYSWSGPGGFTSSQQNPIVNGPGSYIMTVTASNGCSSTATAVVDQDILKPNVVAAGDTIDCNNPSVMVSGNSSTSGTSFAWTGPNGFSASTKNASVNTPGNYVLVVTGPNGCTDTQTANVPEDRTPPTVSANSPDILTCTATTVSINGSVTSTASPLQTISWTGPGSFTSSDEDPQVSATGDYTMTATSENGCTSTTTVFVNQDIMAPNVSAFGGTLTCTITQVLLGGNSTTPGATFQWMGPGGYTSTDEDPTITVDGTYDLIVTGLNGCTNSATTTVNLDGQFPTATASASLLTLDCKNPATTLNGTSTTPGVTFGWSGPNGFGAGTASVPNVSEPGNYVLAVTAPNGCVQTENITINQDITTPDISVVGDTIDCISGQGNLTATSATGGATFLWTGPGGFTSPQQNPLVTVDGPYLLVITGPNGCTSTATTDIAKNTDAPQVAYTIDALLTCADTVSTNIASISTVGATGIWTGPGGFNSTLDTINVKVAGIYTFTATALNGCKSSEPITITENKVAPTVSLSGGTINCTNPTLDLNPTVTISNPGFFWVLPDGSGAPAQKVTAIVGGVYTLTVNDFANGCVTTVSATVVEDKEIPVITIKDYILTCTDPQITIDIEVSMPVIYDWVGDNGFEASDEDILVEEEAVFTVTVTAANGCTSTGTSEVFLDMQVPGASAQQGIILTCTQPSQTITATSPATSVSYSWTGPGGFTSNIQTPTINQTGVYTVIITDTNNGCTSQASAEVAPDASIPQVSALGGTVTCTVLDVQITATSSQQNVTWNWSGPGGFTSTDQNPTVTAAGNYTVTVTATNGCTTVAGAEILASIATPTVNVGTPDKLDCTTTQVSLSATVAKPGNYDFKWVTANGTILSGANSPSPIASQAGTYTVLVTDQSNGCTGNEDVIVEVDPATPSGVNELTKSVSCFGYTDGSISIASVVGGTAPFLYSLDNQPFGATTTFTFLPPGDHALKIQDANGCEFETVLKIGEPEELTVNLGLDTTIHLGEFITLSLDDAVSDTGRIEKVVITPAAFDTVFNKTFQPTYSVQYKLTVIDSNGCKASDERLIIVDKERLVFIPNIFDPTSIENGLFTVFGGEGTERVISMKVFDRWGESQHEYFDFAPGDPKSAWDGKVRGKDANPAVFVYYAEIKFLDGEVKVYKGDVALVRNNK